MLSSRKKVLVFSLALLGILLLGAFFVYPIFQKNQRFLKKETAKNAVIYEKQLKDNQEESSSYQPAPNASKITGLPCDNFDKRPFAVMYTGDRKSRKYFANLSQADLVLEMAHRPMHGQPRLMGVFQCNTPEIVGPMRSGRTDHISVAGSLDAIYVPWGGSSVGKNLLKKGVIDSIDCNGEVYPGGGSACFRRSGPMSTLESASSSVPKLIERAEEVGYRKESQLTGFAHQGDITPEQRPSSAIVKVNYEKPNQVSYQYNPETNAYLRFIEDEPDVDFETKQQYAPKNLITIKAKKEAWSTSFDYEALGLINPWTGIDFQHQQRENGEYPNMQLGDPWFDTVFSGPAEFFFNGKHITGTWKREKGISNPFQFAGQSGAEIHFAPGQIWLHIIEDYNTVEYETL